MKRPHFNEEKICSKLCNRLEYFWKVHMIPIIYISMAVIFGLLSLFVGISETSLYLNLDSSWLLPDWKEFSEQN